MEAIWRITVSAIAILALFAGIKALDQIKDMQAQQTQPAILTVQTDTGCCEAFAEWKPKVEQDLNTLSAITNELSRMLVQPVQPQGKRSEPGKLAPMPKDFKNVEGIRLENRQLSCGR